MKTVITRLIIAVVLAAGAWLSWSEAKLPLAWPRPKSGSRRSICSVDDDLDADRTLSDYLPVDAQPLSD